MNRRASKYISSLPDKEPSNSRPLRRAYEVPDAVERGVWGAFTSGMCKLKPEGSVSGFGCATVFN